MTEVKFALEAGIEVKTQVNGEYVNCYWKLSPEAVKYNASEEITLAEAKELGLIKEAVSESEALEAWLNQGGVIVVNKRESVAAKQEESDNDYTVLVNEFNGKVPMGNIMNVIKYLNKKNIGTVNKVEMELRNGDLVGNVYGSNGNFRVWHSMRVSSKGRQHFKINVSKF